MAFGLAKTFLAMGISVLFVAFVAYGLYALYEPPKAVYTDGENTCYQTFKCEELLTASNEYRDCIDMRSECNQKAAEERQKPQIIYARNSFIILMSIGLAAIIAGIFLASLEGIGSGLIGGGVLVVVWALIYTARFWMTLHKGIKLAFLGLILGILIYFGYKKLEKKEEVPQAPPQQ